jgi:PhnB protein
VARTSTYLHFSGTTEEAFNFYKAAFGTEFVGPIERMGDLPVQPGQPELSAAEKNQVASVTLPITGGHLLVGNDAPAWMGTLVHGNAVDIGVELDTRAEAERIFAALAEGADVEYPFQEMAEGTYFGSLVDKFGTQWLVSCSEASRTASDRNDGA